MGKRRLFLAHASELAYLVTKAAGSGGVVHAFVQNYAKRRNRRALLHNPEHLREIESTIGRESVLAMAAEVRRRVPRVFASKPRGGLLAQEAALAEAFQEEFEASLGRAVADSPGQSIVEDETFGRDLEIYNRWGARHMTETRVTGAPSSLESPFPDRCALLLDPSMMEEARLAAVGFEKELEQLAAKLFERLGRQGPQAVAARGRRRTGTKAARGAKQARKAKTKRRKPRVGAARRAGRRRQVRRSRPKSDKR